MKAEKWLPHGKKAAVCFSIDDVHPGRSTDPYEAGGDLKAGVLGRLEWLMGRHPCLLATLFITPDWRLIAPRIERKFLAKIPKLRDSFYLSKIRPRPDCELSRHPEFVTYVKGLPNIDVGIHGLHHVRKGPNLVQEFAGCSADECSTLLRKAESIFERASLSFVSGICPPAWTYTAALGEALVERGFTFVASARDIITPIADGALTAMSGLLGVSLIYPTILKSGLLHYTTNFQATSEIRRSFAIIEEGGLLMIKAHAAKTLAGHVMLDGLDSAYANYLDVTLSAIESRYGDEIWWTSMSQITKHILLATPPNTRSNLGQVYARGN